MLKNLFRSKSIYDALTESKIVKVKGIKFEIRRIDALNFLDGSNVLKSTFELYSRPDKSNTGMGEADLKKIKKYLSEVIFASVVEPKLALTKDQPGLLIEKLFVDWEMVNSLYEEIMAFTYGKKKVTVSS